MADPFLVLGLPRDATLADVKRAYRRLAKVHHPDSAGAAALPRFLEIQRAYEVLLIRLIRPGGAARRSPSGASPAPAWQADATRARATPGATPGATDPGGTRSGGTRPGAAGPRRRASAPPGDERSGATPGGGRRRRGTRRATFGSTSYDDAHETPDPSWAGASWYGPSTGEYWRVNPREYADPRKHGPEYQARAAERAAREQANRERVDTARDRRRRPEPAASSRPEPAATPRSEPAAFARPEPPPSPQPDPAMAGVRDHWPRDGGPEATSRGASPGSASPDRSWTLPLWWESAPPLFRRLVGALLAWPPLGIAAAAVIGEATGCAAFEATCAPPAELYPWAAQAAIVLGLVALPAAARVLAAGTIAVAILAFPAAAVLSASGATYDRSTGPAALLAVLAVGWVIGVGVMLARRVRPRLGT